MGLVSSLSNAVSGLRVSQDSITILSRNVANAGTPGYHSQSLNIVDHNSANASYARTAGVNRAFNSSLQTYYNRQVSDTAASNVAANYLNKLQTYLGKPGQAGSLDTMFSSFQNSLRALSTSPDDYSTRATVVAEAQAMAQRLNQLSTNIQEIRQETETRIANNVNDANAMLISLQEVNKRMLDLGMTDTARASLHDQRDRLVASIAEVIDVRADYRSDGTVALMTRSGVGLLDNGVSTFKFSTAGALSATTQASIYTDQNRVGTLTLTTPSGLTIDLVQQNVLQGGELAGLVTLRDKTLVEAQNQLDEIAAGLAAAFSTINTEGTPTPGDDGLAVDVSGLAPGNDVLISFSVNGAEKKIRLINSEKGQNYNDASGQRVVHVDFSDPASVAAVAADIQTRFGVEIDVTGGVLSVVDDGAGGVIDITRVTARTTATGSQTGEKALPLFVDQSNTPFTGNLDTDPPQILGFASRISVNPAILGNNGLLVQSDIGTSLGDAARPNYLLSQLNSMTFVSGGSPSANMGRHQLNGTVEQIIGQVINFQGTSIATALRNHDDRLLTLETITTQMETDYGVNIDEEMARLTELQSAYAANARVVSVVKELLDTLFAST